MVRRACGQIWVRAKKFLSPAGISGLGRGQWVKANAFDRSATCYNTLSSPLFLLLFQPLPPLPPAILQDCRTALHTTDQIATATPAVKECSKGHMEPVDMSCLCHTHREEDGRYQKKVGRFPPSAHLICLIEADL